jgi:hypothetical protein
MVRFVRLTPELLAWVVDMAGDELTRTLTDHVPALYERLLDISGAAEAMLDDGMVIGAGGVAQHWPGRAEAWLMLVPGATLRQRTAALRRCQDRLTELQRFDAFRRIEMYVQAGTPWCAGFARTMGFRLEGTAEAWSPNGQDYHLYARVARKAQPACALVEA